MLGTGYTLSAKTTLPFEDAVERVRDELKNEGFGVLCEIDVQATLKEKLGVDGEPYMILGACNPPLAHRALEAEPELGTLLPCNVVVYRDESETHIAIDRRADALHRRQRRAGSNCRESERKNVLATSIAEPRLYMEARDARDRRRPARAAEGVPLPALGTSTSVNNGSRRKLPARPSIEIGHADHPSFEVTDPDDVEPGGLPRRGSGFVSSAVTFTGLAADERLVYSGSDGSRPTASQACARTVGSASRGYGSDWRSKPTRRRTAAGSPSRPSRGALFPLRSICPSRPRSSSGLCRSSDLAHHLLHRRLAALGHLLAWHVLDVRRDRPQVAERVGDRAEAVAPEHVLGPGSSASRRRRPPARRPHRRPRRRGRCSASTRRPLRRLDVDCGNGSESMISESPISSSAWAIFPPGASMRIRSFAPNACL